MSSGYRYFADCKINVKDGTFEDLPFCVTSMCACRSNMEDENSVELDILSDTSNPSIKIFYNCRCFLQLWHVNLVSYFAVFDGHGGGSVSKRAAKELLNNIKKSNGFPDNLNEAIHDGFER